MQALKILLSCKNTNDLNLLQAKLASSYYTINTVSDKRNTLSDILEYRPDVILTDSPDLCVESSQQNFHQITATILITPSGAPEPLNDRQVDDFLITPIDDVTLFVSFKKFEKFKKRIIELSMLKKHEINLKLIPTSNARVLIVSSSDKQTSIIRNALNKSTPKIVETPNALKAIKLLSKDKFDLIFLSLDGKNEDTLSYLRYIKSNIDEAPPIILIENLPDKERIAYGIQEYEADDFINQAYPPHVISARYRSLIKYKRFKDIWIESFTGTRVKGVDTVPDIPKTTKI